MKKASIILFLLLVSITTISHVFTDIEVRKAISVYKVKPYELSRRDISYNVDLKIIKENPYKIPEIYYEPNNKKYKIKLELADGWIKKNNGTKNPVGLQISIEY
jgi:hypothetical protein